MLAAASWLVLAGLALGFGDRIGVIAERMKPAPNAKAWDKYLMAAFMPLAGAVIVVAALDGGRFHWTPGLPLWVYPPAVAAFCAAAVFHLWAIVANEVLREHGCRAARQGAPGRRAGTIRLRQASRLPRHHRHGDHDSPDPGVALGLDRIGARGCGPARPGGARGWGPAP
ncbi:MAG: hypothetical protein MZV64_42770 [Ignavibacteriales bacterium]|nr:hypothetical protein [Ignavibacteriales bacterium]